ncbi:hypothetical protein GQR58_016538 [Nymphon striatum]|nr:hypothetical protein GQR58_016538 [Nymphon striatum]
MRTRLHKFLPCVPELRKCPKAKGILKHFKNFKFVGVLHYLNDVLGVLRKLSLKLQEDKVYFATISSLIDLTVGQLGALRLNGGGEIFKRFLENLNETEGKIVFNGTELSYVDRDVVNTDVSTSKNLVLYVDGQTIATALLCFLEIHGIPVAKVVGLGSNGAAVMTGKGKGVTGLLLNQNPLMINIHCIAHRLALVTEQAAKDIPGINDIKDTIVSVWIGLKLCYDNNLHKRAHEVIELIYIDLWSGDELIEAKVRLLKLRDEAVICHNQYSEMLSDEDADKEEAWIVDLEDAINH